MKYNFKRIQFILIILLFNNLSISQVVINEMCINPKVGDGSMIGAYSSTGGFGEWIELYNTSCNTVDISGYIIGTYNGFDGKGMSFTVPPGKTIGPNGFAIIRGANKTAPASGILDIKTDIAITANYCVESINPNVTNERVWFENGGGWMALYDKSGTPKDMVQWGNMIDPSDLDGNPCNPTSSNLPSGMVLSSFKSYPSGKSITTGASKNGFTLLRLPDGGTWSEIQKAEANSYGSSNQPVTASIDYADPFCTTQGKQSVTLTGTTGGTFSCTSTDLTINSTTGEITPTNKEGTYTVRYTLSGLTCPGYVETTVKIENPTVVASWVKDPDCTGVNLNKVGSISYTTTKTTGAVNCSIDDGVNFSYTTSPITGLGNGIYKIKIKDANGCIASDLNAITMNVNCTSTSCIAPKISKEPQDAKLCEGSDTSFTVNATGTSLSYQWQEDKGTGFTNLTGETFTTLKRTAVTSSTNGYKYRCVVTEATNGPCSTNSKTVTLTVETKPTATAGGSATICSSGSATLSGATATAGTTYSWTSNGGGAISNGTTLTPTYTPIASDGGKTITLTMKIVSGNSCPNPADVTYTVIVDQPQTASAGGSTTICSDATATVSGATASTGTTYSWTEDGAGSISNGSTTLTPTYTPISTDAGKKVTLTMKTVSSNKCPNPADVTYTINVDPLPTATAGGSKTICSSSSAIVSGAAFTNGTYTWGHDGNGTITNGNTLTPTYTPTNTDEGKTVTLTLTVTSNNSCSTSSSNKATATYKIDVTAGITTTATAGGSSTICMSKVANVSGANYSNGTILWTHNGHGSLASETTITPTYTSTVDDTLAPVILTLTVTPIAGCGGNTATDTYTVNVKSNPKVIPTSTKPCDGKDVQLNANTIAGAQYAWTGPNGFSEPTQSATITSVTGNKIGLYTLKITDANNCINTADVNVNVNPNPTLSGDNLVCVDKTIKLTASTSSSTTSWVSQKPMNLAIDPNTGIATGVLGGTSDVTFTDVNSCTATKTITVEDLPVVLFTVDSTSVCIGNDVKFTDKSPIKNTNILWDFGDGTNSIDIDPSYAYLKIDSFTVTLTSTSPNGCVGSLTKKKYITPIDVPTMNFVYTPDSIDIYNPVIQFKNLSNAKFYTWNFDDYSPVSNLKDPTHIFPDTPGQSYSVTLKGSNSMSGVCPASVVHEITAIDPAIFYIPNTFTPNADEINNTFQPIFTSGYDPQHYSLWIYDRLGELVFESHNASVGWDGTYHNILAENNTYVWKLQFKSKQTNKEYYRTGHVNLVK